MSNSCVSYPVLMPFVSFRMGLDLDITEFMTTKTLDDGSSVTVYNDTKAIKAISAAITKDYTYGYCNGKWDDLQKAYAARTSGSWWEPLTKDECLGRLMSPRFDWRLP
jgi:hypothetical protein